MVQDYLSGVELLSLYGDERIGAFLPGLRKAAKKAVKFTPQYFAYRGVKAGMKKLHGEDERMGAFLPGVMKTVKKVGKVTSGITTAVASTVVPKSVLDVAAKFDPTKKGGIKPVAAVKAIVSPPVKTAVVVKPEAMRVDVKKVAIIAGSGVGALILLKLLMSARRRSEY